MHPSRMQKGTCIQLPPHRWFWGIQIYQYITFCWIYHSTRDSGLETKQHANHSNCFFPGISPLEESPNLHTGKRNLIRGWYIHGRQTEGLNQLQDWHDISTCWITQSLGYLFGDSSAFLLLSGNSASHSGWLVLYTEWASQDTSTWQTGWSILDLDPRALEPSNHGFLIGRYLCFIGGRPLVMQRAHPRRLDGRSIRSSCPGPRVLRSFWESFSHPLVWACCKRPNLEPHSNVASHRNPLPQISRR